MSEFSHDLAVVIGIDRYANGVAPLQSAVSDVSVIARQLQQDHHYQVLSLIDQQATLANLQHLLAVTLPQQVKPNSRLLFYFAGHGIALNGDDGPEGYLIPQDARVGDTRRYLSMPVLQAALSELPCRHFLGILDCCFAGAFRWSSTRDIGYVPEVIHKERYDRFIQDPAWQIITSAAYDQRALDALSIETHRGQVGNHSPFASALLTALSGEADLYPPAKQGAPAGDGVITATELYLYLREQVEPVTEARAQRQTPGIWPLQKHDKGEYIFLSPGHVLNLPPAPALDKSKNPYRGLRAFEPANSDLFFGRQKLSEQLFETVSKQPLTVVLGASGSGKSSLVKAGLMPKLLEHGERTIGASANRWQILPILRLGEDPFSALQQVLSEEGQYSTLTDYMAARHRSANCKVVLVIDQFEELITLDTREPTRASFLEILGQAIAAYPNQLRIVLTLRADFEPQFQDSALQLYWSDARFIVTPMTRTDLRAAIVQPAAERVIYFQSDDAEHPLVDRLIDEVADMPGALPLLSFTLSELYLKYLQRQDRAKRQGQLIERTITEADYRELGGVARSLTQRADEEYASLVARDPAYAQTIRNVMLRMVAVGGAQVARRSVPLEEFDYLTAENQRVKTVIQQFTAARLLVEGRGADRRAYVEPAHDALILGWQKLLAWQQAEEADLILQRRLTPAAQEWRSHTHQSESKILQAKAKPVLNALDRALYAVENRVNSVGRQVVHLWPKNPRDRSPNSSQQFLWHTNPYLDIFQQTLETDSHRLNKLEASFVEASLLLRRRSTSWRWRIAIATILGLSGLLIAALAGRRADLIGQIRTARNAAEVNLRAGQSLDALNESLAAAQIFEQPMLKIFRPDDQLRSQVTGTLQKMVYSTPERNRLTTDQGTVRSHASPNGEFIVSAGEDGTVTVWDWQGQQQAQWITQQGRISSVQTSPDSQTVATGSADGSVRLWNIEGQLLANLQEHRDIVSGLAFSPDGRLLATSGRDKTIRLWNLQQRRTTVVMTGHKDYVWSVAFSPDGQRLASASDDGTFRIWNLQGKQLQPFDAQQGNLHVVRFSPDGERVATAGEDGQIQLWSLKNKPVVTLKGHQGLIWDLNFNSLGQLGSASGDGTARLWSVTGEPLAVLESHQGPVRTVSFAPDDQQLVTSGDDSTLRLWNFQRQPAVTMAALKRSSRAISPDGQQIATADADGVVRLRSLEGELLSQFEGHLGAVRSVAFSPNGEQIASGGEDGTVRLWSIKASQAIAVFQVYSAEVNSVSFQPKGTLLSSGDSAGNVQIWDIKAKEPFASWSAHPGTAVREIKMGDQELITLAEDGDAYVWPLEDFSQLQVRGCRLIENYLSQTADKHEGDRPICQ